jgi:polyhydroxyalkanoate synthesis regulator phasin
MKNKTPVEKAVRMLKAVRKRIDSVEGIDVSKFNARIGELEKNLEANPVEVREELIALAKEIAELKRQIRKLK